MTMQEVITALHKKIKEIDTAIEENKSKEGLDKVKRDRYHSYYVGQQSGLWAAINLLEGTPGL